MQIINQIINLHIAILRRVSTQHHQSHHQRTSFGKLNPTATASSSDQVSRGINCTTLCLPIYVLYGKAMRFKRRGHLTATSSAIVAGSHKRAVFADRFSVSESISGVWEFPCFGASNATGLIFGGCGMRKLRVRRVGEKKLLRPYKCGVKFFGSWLLFGRPWLGLLLEIFFNYKYHHVLYRIKPLW